LPALAAPPELVFRLGLDRLSRDQSDIAGLRGLSLFVVKERGYFIGQSLYSAALGQGGGFFVGGVEAGKYTPFGRG